MNGVTRGDAERAAVAILTARSTGGPEFYAYVAGMTGKEMIGAVEVLADWFLVVAARERPLDAYLAALGGAVIEREDLT